jgi:uncharacterized membrane protein YebE (DUF533 family)
MILSSSRRSALLSKEAFVSNLVGAGIRGATKALLHTGKAGVKTVGTLAKTGPGRAALGATAIGALTVPAVAAGTDAQNAYEPPTPTAAPSYGKAGALPF